MREFAQLHEGTVTSEGQSHQSRALRGLHARCKQATPHYLGDLVLSAWSKTDAAVDVTTD